MGPLNGSRAQLGSCQRVSSKLAATACEIRVGETVDIGGFYGRETNKLPAVGRQQLSWQLSR